MARRRDMVDQYFIRILENIEGKTKLAQSKVFIQHGETSLYKHSVLVAYMSYRIAVFLRLTNNVESLITGALLHDYFLYDWHEKSNRKGFHGFRHPFIAEENASRVLDLNMIEKDIILKHMFPLTIVPPSYKESWIVTVSDKICSVFEIMYLTKKITFLKYKMLFG